MIKQLILAATIGLATLPALAVDIAVAPGEAYLRVTEGDKNILFVDVRDPVEIMFVGFADTVHVNVPFMLVDRSAWDEKRNVFRLYQNPDFIRKALRIEDVHMSRALDAVVQRADSAIFATNGGFFNVRRTLARPTVSRRWTRVRASAPWWQTCSRRPRRRRRSFSICAMATSIKSWL